MTNRLPAGPYRQIHLNDGTQCPLYIIPFDKHGTCIGPRTRQHLVDAVKQGDYSDVFLFSHGWNNDWTVATSRYEHFLSGYMNMRKAHNLPMPANYRPLLVGIFWPSTALVFTDSEKGPAIAGGDPEAVDEAVAEELDELAALAEDLTPEQSEKLYALAQKDALSEEESLELAEIIKTFYNREDDELLLSDPVSAQELVEIWAAAAPEPEELDDFGTVGGVLHDDPQAAGFFGDLLKKLDPRPIIRTATVYQMKDRAGKVGFKGVGPLLVDLLKDNNARVHLIGHSYGGKVVLSAASVLDDSQRNIESMLLLQPAVSHLCFADVVPKTGRKGGYRDVLDRVNNPVFSTFSKHDFPLTKTFHLALRRKDDLGEARIAASGEPPSKYAALGGYGPRRCGEKIIDIHNVSEPYDLDANIKIYGLRGDETIGGHGEISNESTWWALYSLASE